MAIVAPAAICAPFKSGEAFPVIPMPDSAPGELRSIADFRGEKLMLQIFAGW